MRPGRIIFALMLIAAGALLLLINLNILPVSLSSQWPLILILAGIGMWMGFIDNRRDWGLLIPGTILLCIGALFYACSVYTWRLMGQWWPVFIIAPGLGLLFANLLGARHFGLMIPASILIGIGLIMLLQIHLNNYALFLPALFIIAGLIVLGTAFRGRKRRQDDQQQ